MENTYEKINKKISWKIIVITMIVIFLSFCSVFWFILPSEFLGIKSPMLEKKVDELRKMYQIP